MQLPLLNAMRTFVVAAEYLNFRKAADELLVSPSAVSHQIKILEDYLGFNLFIRKKRSLTLSTEGKRLFDNLYQPFNQISYAFQDIREFCGRNRLNVSVRPFLSSFWMAQQKIDFSKRYPSVDINFVHNLFMPNFLKDDINLAIIWGQQDDWKDLAITTEKYLDGNLTPVCSKKYIEKYGYPDSPEALKKHLLIHDENHVAWKSWFKLTTKNSQLGSCNINIDDTNVRVQATLNDRGVMLGCPTLLKPYLDRGELVQLFEECLDNYAYYIAYPNNVLLSNYEKDFLDWIYTETVGNVSIKRIS